MLADPQEKTGLGNYFVANYPPFSSWKPTHLPDARAALHAAPEPGTPLGLYLHIPFCRKRCKFCYFRVYTDKNARDVETYLDALVKEVTLYSRLPIVGGRSLQVRLLRRRHAIVPERRPAPRPDDTPAGRAALDRGRGSDLRVRARHLAAAQAGSAARAGRHPAQPGHRELRRSHPRVQRPGASVRGDLPRLRLGPRAWVSIRSIST